jgi:RHS repeat-associated protein
METRLDTGAWQGRGWCDQDINAVVRADKHPVTIRLTNIHPEFSRSPLIELNSYDDIAWPGNGFPPNPTQLVLQPQQIWTQTISGYDIVSAKCSGTFAQASSVWFGYRIGTGDWIQHSWCDQGAGFVIRMAKQPITIGLSNILWEFDQLRTPTIEVRPYNDIARPSSEIPTGETPLTLLPQQVWTQTISGYDVVSAKCSGAFAQASDVWFGYRIGTGSWIQHSWCDQGAGFVIRMAKQPITIGLSNNLWGFDQLRTPTIEVRPYNDIHIAVDSAAVAGPDLYNSQIPSLGPQVKFELTIDNPPQTIFDACGNGAEWAGSLKLSDYDGTTWQARGYCDNSPQGQFTGAEGATVQIVNELNSFGAERRPHLHVWGAGFDQTRLRDDQVRTPEDCACHQPSPQPSTTNPVNTRTGNFWTQVTDLAVQTPGPALVWTRTYNSQAITDTADLLGPGWQTPFAARLILPNMPGGEPGMAIVLSGKGNRLRFEDLGNQHDHRAVRGVYSTLVQLNDVYIQTLRDQQQLTFEATTGRLVGMRDAQGRLLILTYSGTPARLTRIADSSDSTRFLALTYTTSGQVDTVSDGARMVDYRYDTNGNLDQVQDVLGRPTTYMYQNHLLTEIENALGQTVEAMTYDTYTPARKVIEQTLQDGRQITFTYTSAATTLTTIGPDGRQSVSRIDFGVNNAMAGMQINGQAVLGTGFDVSFSPRTVQDGNGNTTRTRFTTTGLPLETTNALGQTERYTYDERNNVVERTDALGVSTRYRYDNANQVISTTVGITTTSPLRATTLYTYTAAGQLLEQHGQDGVVTRYAYDPLRPLQVISATISYGTPQGQTTTFGYDQLGRVVTTTIGFGTALARAGVTRYRADNSVEATIQNYQDGVFDPQQPDGDVVTTYGYDLLGRQVWTRDALGHYTATHYNAAGRVDWTARSLAPLTLDSQGQPILQPFSPVTPDTNVATLYGYDGLGGTELVTETGILDGGFDPATLRFSTATTRVTRTEYDQLSRPVTTTLNYRPGLPTSADTNVRLYTHYDDAGNVVEQIDALGRSTVTRYDTLNRPSAVIANFENGDPWIGPGDTDLITALRYDPAGRLVRQIDNYSNGVFDVTQPITDRVTLYQYDTLGRAVTTTLNYDLTSLGYRTDTNRTSVTAYDPVTGRALGQRDALGRWVSQQYDVLGRVTTAIQNCRNAQGAAVATGCVSFDPATPDRNVHATIHYDALGRAFESLDALGTVTHSAFDQLGRPVATTQNYVVGAPTTPITNVTTLSAYDALGQTTSMTDALGFATHTTANGLGQTVLVTDTMGRVTRSGYDGTGALRWTKRNDGQLTVYQLDGLGRTVATIANYQDGIVSAGEAADRDLIARTVYDAAGRRVQTIDPAGGVTAFAYDDLDRLVAVTEHAVSGICGQPPCNVLTQYQYDRMGNRTAIVDARGYVRRFGYDAAGQLISATDPLGHVTRWRYDAGGRRTDQEDPRGRRVWVEWYYDDLDRLVQQRDSHDGTTFYQTTMAYDALGRRQEVSNFNQITTFAYDPLGRLTAATNQPGDTLRYGYDAAGQRTQLIYPGGRTLDYQYWPDGQLKQVLQGTLLAYYSYDDAGRLASVARLSGNTSYEYDGADRLVDLDTDRLGGEQISRYQYTLDRRGQRTQAIETQGSQTRTLTYSYDPLGRLTGALNTDVFSANYTYAYDDAGNRTDVWRNGTLLAHQDYNAANQVLGWSYDPAGNLLNDGATTYAYDALNRLTRRGSTTYTYDDDDQLIYDGTTRYVQDVAAPLSQVLQTTQGVTTTDYLYGMDRLAAVTGATRTWYGGDGLGSVRQTFNDAGIVQGSTNYDPWGKVESGSVPMFGFTGELQDTASSLVYLRARWYNAVQGRFGSRDPFEGFADQPYSLHPYAYAMSNPVLYSDPTGNYYSTGNEDPSGCPEGYTWVASFQRAYGNGCVPNNNNTNLPDGPIASLLKKLNSRQDLGIISGVSGATGGVLIGADAGYERVFDLYDFEVASFTYGGSGWAGSGYTDRPFVFWKGWRCPITLGGNAYLGIVTGWKNYDEPGIKNYKGWFRTYSGGATVGAVGPIPFILGGQAFTSLGEINHSPDGKMSGFALSVGTGNDKLPVGGSVMDNDYSQPFWKKEFHGFRVGKPIPPTEAETNQFVQEVKFALLGNAALAATAEAIIRNNARIWTEEQRVQR